jgi:hypothetical protein
MVSHRLDSSLWPFIGLVGLILCLDVLLISGPGRALSESAESAIGRRRQTGDLLGMPRQIVGPTCL